MRFFHKPDPRSASYWPRWISWAAAHSCSSERIFFAQRAKVLSLNTRFFTEQTIAFSAMGGDKVFQLVLHRLVQDAMPALSPTGDESPLSAAAAIEAQQLC